MNLLILSSHGVLEYDDLRLFTQLGYDVFMPGGYADPRQGNDVRPAVPEAPYHEDLAALVVEQREKHAGQSDAWPIVDWGKADLHPAIIDWADVIMVNCFPESWIGLQWPRIRHKRVIWRTIGQSDPNKERLMSAFRRQGLEIVRYSPAEKRGFEKARAFAGEDAVIRFAKDAADYGPWIGDDLVVGNLAQHDKVPGQRDPFLNWPWVKAATDGLPFKPAGPNSELVGGLGMLTYPAILDYLRHIRCMVYSGTQPASYTLGLMEAMLTGTPVVSIGPGQMWLPELFEGRELTFRGGDDPKHARMELAHLLEHRDSNPPERQRAIELFSYDAVGPQWLDFLGAPVPKREMVAA